MARFAVFRRRGGAWESDQSMREQRDWSAHAAFMNHLVDEGRVLLGGPLDATDQILLLMEAESPSQIREVLADDPWASAGLLAIERVANWQLLMNALEAE